VAATTTTAEFSLDDQKQEKKKGVRPSKNIKKLSRLQYSTGAKQLVHPFFWKMDGEGELSCVQYCSLQYSVWSTVYSICCTINHRASSDELLYSPVWCCVHVWAILYSTQENPQQMPLAGWPLSSFNSSTQLETMQHRNLQLD